MNDKFKLVKSDKKTWNGKPLYQLVALKDFGDVKKGEKGGYVEKEANVSVYGNAWVFGDARVYGNAWVFGDARVFGDAQVFSKLKLEAGFFFGSRHKSETVQEIAVDDYFLIAKGDVKTAEGDEKKTALLEKADELIAKANELKAEAEKM